MFFNEDEKRKFAEADFAQWRQLIINQAVDLVPIFEEGKIPKDKIISAPMRYVRTRINTRMRKELLQKHWKQSHA